MLCSTACWRRAIIMLACCLPLAASQNIETVVLATVDRISCDFDLTNLAEIMPHLPQHCQTIYYAEVANGQQPRSALYQLYEEEATAFADYARKLDAYEWPAGQDEPNFDSVLRTAIYDDVNLLDCGSSNNNITSTDEYLLCQKERYTQLTNAVPQ